VLLDRDMGLIAVAFDQRTTQKKDFQMLLLLVAFKARSSD
jgi:hypothetical protein